MSRCNVNENVPISVIIYATGGIMMGEYLIVIQTLTLFEIIYL